jgi:nitrate/nitrite transport system ATP-binding protein
VSPHKYLECWKLTKAYPTPAGPVAVVKAFDLDVFEGEFVSLIGHSGCGKSTVLGMVAGLTAKTSGSIILADKEVRGPAPDRGVVFQSPCLLPWLTAYDNVMLGVDQVYPDATRGQRRQIVEYYLDVVGLAHAMRKKPEELSQGMRQRVGIARAFALSPKMLLLDEPFGMLDQLTRFELQDVLVGLWSKDRKTALMVTHDVDEALFLSDRVVMMTNGPEAKVGEILAVTLPRPRDRTTVMEHPHYYPLRERIIDFLEAQGHAKQAPAAKEASAEAAPIAAEPAVA